MLQKRSASQTLRAPLQSPHSPRAAAAGPSKQAWAGHHPVTRLVLEGIFERARLGNDAASTAERVLANVCELRCAIAGSEWLEHLTADGNCLRELAAARFALNEVGALNVAAYFSEAMVAMRYSYSRAQRQRALRKVERHLSSAGPALDGLIARFAQGLLDAEIHSGDYGQRTPSFRRWLGLTRASPMTSSFVNGP